MVLAKSVVPAEVPLRTMSTGVPARSEADLTEVERSELRDAHSQLRLAVAAHDRYCARPLEPGQHLVPLPAKELLVAQDKVAAAEARLWEVRERLLGWERPAWAPSAAQVSDWLSPEDAIYD